MNNKKIALVTGGSRLKNITLQIVGFEGFFNLNNIAPFSLKSITTLNLNTLQEVRIHLSSENIISVNILL